MEVIDVDGIDCGLRTARGELGRAPARPLLAAYEHNAADGPFSIETAAIARRALKNTALAYLAWAGDPQGQDLARASSPRPTT